MDYRKNASGFQVGALTAPLEIFPTPSQVAEFLIEELRNGAFIEPVEKKVPRWVELAKRHEVERGLLLPYNDERIS